MPVSLTLRVSPWQFTTLGPYLAAALLSNHTVIYASIDSTLSPGTLTCFSSISIVLGMTWMRSFAFPDESFQVEVTSASTSYVRSLLSGLMFRPQAAKVLDIKGAVLAPNDPSADVRYKILCLVCVCASVVCACLCVSWLLSGLFALFSDWC